MFERQKNEAETGSERKKRRKVRERETVESVLFVEFISSPVICGGIMISNYTTKLGTTDKHFYSYSCYLVIMPVLSY